MPSKNKTLVFIGTIKKVANCGESMKNHLFIDRFREVFDKVITVDVWEAQHLGFLLCRQTDCAQQQN